MKLIAAVLVFSFCPTMAGAQGLPAQSLTKGTWDLGVFAGGGTGLAHASNTQFVIAGGRVGRILTRDHLRGWLRGNFEFAADFLPIYLVDQPGGTLYGGSVKPVILKWNFTSNHRVAPYAIMAGGVFFTTRNVPPGDTSYVNFTPQGALGLHIFTRPKRAITVELQGVHHSNAGLGAENPGLNASLIVTFGYTWFK